MKYVVFGILLACSSAVQAQTTEQDTTAAPSPWSTSWVVSLTGNQADYQHWSRGGVNSTAYVAATSFRTRYDGSAFANGTRIDMRFGQVNQEGIGIEKTEDIISINNKTDLYLHSDHWSAFVDVTFRTQFTEGFDAGTGQLISDFMSPGYFIESLGLSYNPYDFFSIQVGAGLKQTFVVTDNLDQFYGLGEDEDIRSEGGLTFALQFSKELFKNFTYTTDLSTFSNLLLPLRSTDMIMTNEFVGKINNFMTASLEMSFIYDDDFTNMLQIKRIISMGVRVMLFER